MFKNPSFIFDILCTVVWLVLAIRYARKGFLAGVVQLTGNLISLFGARQFSGGAAGQVCVLQCAIAWAVAFVVKLAGTLMGLA